MNLASFALSSRRITDEPSTSYGRSKGTKLKGILIIGGEKPHSRFLKPLLKDPGYILAAADGGIDYALEAKLSPHLALGDMDSLKDPLVLSRLEDTEIAIFPKEKDKTDTELGMKELRNRGCSPIVLWGGGGGRLDHILAIRNLYEEPHPPKEWYTAHERIILVEDHLRLEDFAGRRISLFPVGEEECRMRSRGLKWPLDRLVWDRRCFGISNEVTGNQCSIEMISGRLILIHDLGAEDRG